MADFTPVALGVKPPQGMTLGEMLGIAQGAQQYQQAQQMNPLAVQKATADVRTAETGADKSRFDLEKSYAEKARGVFGGFTNDPDFIAGNSNEMIKKLQASQAFLKSMGVPTHPDGTTAQMIELAKTNPKAVRQQLANMTQGEMSAEAKLGAQFPAATMVNTGNQQIPVQMGNQMLTGVKPGTPQNLGIASAVAPGSQETIDTDPLTGNKVVVTKDPSGKVISSRAAPAVPAGGGFNQIMPGESTATIEAMQAERAQAKQSATAAASALTNIETIKKYLPLAQTGKYSEAVAGLQSAFGNLAGSTAEEKAASARDIIQKNIADLGLQKNAALGNKFAADLSAVQQSIADAGKNPTAIMKSMEQLQPLIQHAQLYQQGLEKAIEKSGGNIQVKRKYDNEMVTAFDPKALMAYNAYKAGDKKALSSLSTKEKEDLFAKIQRYARLVNGDL